MMEILAGIGLALVFVYAAGQIRLGLMTVGGLLSFLSAILMLYKPLKDVTRTNIVLQVALASAGRLFEVLDAENDIRQRPGARDLGRFAKELRYEGVTFAYAGAAEPALSGIDLAIQRGETVAIVGPSGAGKTTLVNLLPRLYAPTAGRVSFDGVDLRDATLSSLRRQIGLVTQETILFDTTVAENIATASPRPRRSASARPPAPRAPTSSSSCCPRATRRRWGRAPRSGGQRQRLAAISAPSTGTRRSSHPRRGDLTARQRVGGAHRPRARQPDAGAHHARDRPPPLDGPAGRPDRRAGGGPDPRGGYAPAALDSARPLSQAPRDAVLRGERRRALEPGGALTLPRATTSGRAREPPGADRTAEIVARSVTKPLPRPDGQDARVRARPGARAPARVRTARPPRQGRGRPPPEAQWRAPGGRDRRGAARGPAVEAPRALREISDRCLPVRAGPPRRASADDDRERQRGLSPEETAALEPWPTGPRGRSWPCGRWRAPASPRDARASRLAREGEARARRERAATSLPPASVRALLPDVTLDPGRLEQEAALAADRADVAEELQRLRGHLDQFDALLAKAPEAVGKTLDFLNQEILRELNTLASKSRDLLSTREILEMKAQTEKIREQIQNVE